MNFSAHLDRLDAAAEDHLCDDAAYLVQCAGAMVPARVMVERPENAERLQGVSITRARPEISVSVAAHPGLRQGDGFILGVWTDGVFTPGTEAWRIAEAPRRPGDGRWWMAEVEPWRP